MTVTLQNTGTAPLAITSIQPTGSDAADYSYSLDPHQPCPISPATLANGSSCMLDVTFTPQSGGSHNNAQITITDNNSGIAGSVQTVNLFGTGLGLGSITVVSGSNQNTTVNTAFDNPLVALVTDANNNPVPGVLVTFTPPPGSGASGTFAGGINTAITNAQGQATSGVFTANGITGTYTVPATVNGISAPANFTENNCDNRFLLTRRCRQ